MVYVVGSTRDQAAATAVALVRAHTRPAHVRLEERLGLFAWLATVETYTCMLERFYGFYVRAEPELARTAFGDRRTRAERAPEDAAAGGRPDVARTDAASATRRCRGSGRSVSTVSLKLIEREVGRRLGLEGSSGTAFFGAYGSDAARQWRRFGAVLEREAEELDVDEICDAAAATFAVLDGWLIT